MNLITDEQYDFLAQVMPEYSIYYRLCGETIGLANLLARTDNNDLFVFRRSVVYNQLNLISAIMRHISNIASNDEITEALKQDPGLKQAIEGTTRFTKLVDDLAPFEERLAELRELHAYQNKAALDCGGALLLEKVGDVYYYDGIHLDDFFTRFYHEFSVEVRRLASKHNYLGDLSRNPKQSSHVFKLTYNQYISILGTLYTLAFPIVQIIRQDPETKHILAKNSQLGIGNIELFVERHMAAAQPYEQAEALLTFRRKVTEEQNPVSA
jgi:hypothetical protein